MSSVAPIPEGYGHLTPHLVVKNASRMIEFYEAAFCAERASVCRIDGLDLSMIKDRSGHRCSIATRVEELTEEQEQERARQAFAQG